MSLECPNCKLISSDEAQRCDCGYDFQKKTVEKPYYKQEIPKLNIMERIFTQNNLSKAAMASGMLVFPLVYWWGYHMEITNSALDWYPSRWIYSWPFTLLVFVGSISGSTGIGSFLPNQTVRIFVVFSLGFINPLIFLATIHDKFEYGVDDGVSIFSKISVIGALVCILGWLVSLSVIPILYLVKHMRKAKERQLKTNYRSYV